MFNEAGSLADTPEPTEPWVLLIYPVGNSDLQLLDDSGKPVFIPRGSNFRSLLGAYIGRSSVAQIPEPLRGVALNDQGELRRTAFPILESVLRHIALERRGQLIRIVFLLSDQDPPHHSDTVGVDRAFASWLGSTHAFGDQVAVARPELLTDNPASYDLMSQAFSRIARRLNDQIAAAPSCYFSATAGTPAMTFASATTFGPDARVTFLYSPQGRRGAVERIEHFRRLPRQRTLQLMDDALARFDFEAAIEALGTAGSGFDPERDDVQETLAHLAAANAWRRGFAADAAESATRGRPHHQLAVTRALTATLAMAPGTLPRAQWSTFWRQKMVDIAARLQIARVQGDVPGFIIRLRHFLDVSLLFGLTWYGLTSDAFGKAIQIAPADQNRLALDVNWSHPGFGLEYERAALLAWRSRHARPEDHDAAAMQIWTTHFLQLRDLEGHVLRDFRNRLIHNSVALERDLLDTMVREQFPEPRPGFPPGSGAALLTSGVLQVLAALPAASGGQVNDLVDEWLTIPRRIADDHGLPDPPQCRALRDHLAEDAWPASDCAPTFLNAVAAQYERQVAATMARLAADLPAMKRKLAEQITVATAASGPTINEPRVLKLQGALELVDATTLRPLAEVSLTGVSVWSERQSWLRRRVFRDAAPALPLQDIITLADRFAASPERATVLTTLLR